MGDKILPEIATFPLPLLAVELKLIPVALTITFRL